MSRLRIETGNHSFGCTKTFVQMKYKVFTILYDVSECRFSYLTIFKNIINLIVVSQIYFY